MEKKRKLILGIIAILILATTACSLFEIISSDDVIATEVSEALEDALEETAAAATYTPYPTYTPIPTYTANPYSYYYGNYSNYNNLPPQPFSGDNNRPPMPRR